MKTSNDEGTRLLAAVLQQQLAAVGIALDIRSYESATFYSDVHARRISDVLAALDRRQRAAGHLQLRILDRALFPQGRQPQPLLEPPARCPARRCGRKRQTLAKRRADYAEAQQILARDLPAINLWYRDTVVVHNRRLTHVVPAPSGNYVFLETAELDGQA